MVACDSETPNARCMLATVPISLTVRRPGAGVPASALKRAREMRALPLTCSGASGFLRRTITETVTSSSCGAAVFAAGCAAGLFSLPDRTVRLWVAKWGIDADCAIWCSGKHWLKGHFRGSGDGLRTAPSALQRSAMDRDRLSRQATA